MSKSPVYYPEEQGPGRISVLRVFKEEENAGLEKSVTSQLSPLAINISRGVDVKNGGNIVVLADLDPNVKLPDLRVTRGEKAISYSFTGARGSSKSPKAGYYLCNLMRVPKENQPAFLGAMDAYSRGIFYCEEFKVNFLHVVAANEDPEVLMSFQGFPTEKDAKFYFEHPWHWNFAPAVGNLMTALVGTWEGTLRELNTSKL